MKRTSIFINQIPAILWGESSSRLFLAVHGNQSSKSDAPIEMLAQEAVAFGYQVLSFDLPEHGDRKGDGVPCKAQNCVADLNEVMALAKPQFDSISLMANSMGAYFSLLAYPDEPLRQCLFLSPVVDMERIIQNRMKWYGVTEQRLRAEQEIATPDGPVLYWDYYQYVKNNPITKWNAATAVLSGGKDELCTYETISAFARRFHCSVEISNDSAHYFHTAEELEIYQTWLRSQLAKGAFDNEFQVLAFSHVWADKYRLYHLVFG